jgi:hypothetical protein
VLDAPWAAAQGEPFQALPVVRAYDCDAVRVLEETILRSYDQLGETALRIRGRKGGRAKTAKKAAVTRSDYIEHRD